MELLPPALSALAAYNQFIVYKLTNSSSRPGKMDKLPINPSTGLTTNAHDPALWMSASHAIAASNALGSSYGVGFVFTDDDPFWFLDIDNCLEPCGTKWSLLAQQLIRQFPGAAIEVSSSNRGLHIIASGISPPHSCRNAEHNLEFYTSHRFVALTGTHATGNAGTNHYDQLAVLVNQYFPISSAQQLSLDLISNWTTEPRAKYRGPQDDDELIERALRSGSGASVFGDKLRFKDLWEADEAKLTAAYPGNDTDTYNRSSADMALAIHLAWWTGNNCERIQRLMLRSALDREKWRRDDYLPRTILKACGRQNECLITVEEPAKDTVLLEKNQSNGYLTIEQQLDHFKGCVYVIDENRILIPGGYLLDAERFRILYGGHTMPMDIRNEKSSSDAWKVYTQSQAFRCPKAHTTTFKPTLAPGHIENMDGHRTVNIWWPVKTPRNNNDITPFLNHIALLLPNANDQLILICYMSAVLQFPGVKFQWCPLLQGVEGNGKTFLSHCLSFAVGDRYSHIPNAKELAARFNGWLYAKIFIGIEDIYVPESRLEIMEAIKPMITGTRQDVEYKGFDRVTKDICANFLMNTNHKDGLLKTQNDRRFAPFFTAQQSVADLKRDGMWGDYFSNLYSWAKSGGFAAIAQYLEDYEIPAELNPATGIRAPITSSTNSAIERGVGSIEQEILEAVEQEIPGFKGGWISSMALDRLLEKLKATRRIPLNRRRDMLQTLGYDYHPNLTNGRVNNIVLPDNGKPRLYIQSNHKDRDISTPSAIARAYESSQR